ncbi:MAG: LOG family protein, partial [Acidobacteria bacterium]|nr:LOG family protein [Acidobacteriota bacterium]
GGFGTMDEIFETLTLIQTGKIDGFPLVLMGSDYWGPVLEFMSTKMVEAGTISAVDPERIHVTDSPESAARFIVSQVRDRFGLEVEDLVRKKRLRPRWYLGERATVPVDPVSADPSATAEPST